VETDKEDEAQVKLETHLNRQMENANNDINMISDGVTSIVKTYSEILTSDEYFSMARQTCPEQGQLLLEAMYRIICNAEQFPNILRRTGGVWKTFTLMLLMEKYERFCPFHSSSRNSYVA
jgi:hypothetical protein